MLFTKIEQPDIKASSTHGLILLTKDFLISWRKISEAELTMKKIDLKLQRVVLGVVFILTIFGAVNKTLATELYNEQGTPVILEMNGTEVKATLNNTVTAQEFIKLLPYSVTVSRAADDLCGSVSENLASDRSEGKKKWEIGEIGWFGGWFTILVDNEQKFANMPGPGVMIIGKIADDDIETVKAFSGRVEIKVRLTE